MEDIKFDKNKLIDTVKNNDDLPAVKAFFSIKDVIENIEKK